MPTSRNRRRGSNAILLAGLFLAFGLALFTGLFFMYGRLGRTWRGVAELRVLFAQARTLKAGAPVLYDGMEVGRVKDVRVIHLDAALLKAMPALSKSDLHNLPITQEERERIDRIGDERVDGELRKILEGRFMVLAVFDMLIEHDDKRLHVDDAYLIATSKLGDSSIQIVTGGGKVAVPNSGDVLLGINADLMSDIGKNAAQIEEMMHSMADILGGDAGKSKVQDQVRNFESFTENLDKQAASLLQRVPETWDGIDARADESKKELNEITEKVLAIFPKIDAAVAKAEDSINAMHGNLSKSALVAVDELKHYREMAKIEVARWRTLSGDLRDKTPKQMKELRKTAESALAAIGKLDDWLARVDIELKLGSENARAAIGAQTDAAMQVQELTWNFKKSPAYFTSKYTPEQLSQRHLAWRYEMARVQYVELRRELAALQNGLSVNDPADRERTKTISEKLAESDAFFNVDRGDFIPGAEPVAPALPPADPVTLPLPRKEKP